MRGRVCGRGARIAATEVTAAPSTGPGVRTTLHSTDDGTGSSYDPDDAVIGHGADSLIAARAKAIALDSLRALGILRRSVDRPVVGRKAYVRWWERVRALIVLASIVVGLGMALAAAIGISLIVMGTFLEQAVS